MSETTQERRRREYAERRAQENQVRQDAMERAFTEEGLINNSREASVILWDRAYDDIHSSGYEQVNVYYGELLELFQRVQDAS